MEIGEIIDPPTSFQTISRLLRCDQPRPERIRAQHNHIQSPWRSIIHPFGSKLPYRVQRPQIHLLSVNHLIPRRGSHILDVFHEEGIRGRGMREENDLCASSGEGCCHDGADAGRSSLGSSFSWVPSQLADDSSRVGEGVEEGG